MQLKIHVNSKRHQIKKGVNNVCKNTLCNIERHDMFYLWYYFIIYYDVLFSYKKYHFLNLNNLDLYFANHSIHAGIHAK